MPCFDLSIIPTVPWILSFDSMPKPAGVISHLPEQGFNHQNVPAVPGIYPGFAKRKVNSPAIPRPLLGHGYKSSAECYSVLCPFWTKMSIIYRWNQHQMFYLQISLDVAYHISMRIYKLFNLASLPKNDFTLVLYCSMSILNQ